MRAAHYIFPFRHIAHGQTSPIEPGISQDRWGMSGRERGWTDERVETLKTMWAAGNSCSVIAAALGDISRNGCIGKIHRLGLPVPDAKRRAFLSRPPKPSIPRPLPPPAPPPPDAPPSLDLTIEALSDKTCRHPYGTQAPYRFCGVSTERGSPYCPFHKAQNMPLGKPLIKARK